MPDAESSQSLSSTFRSAEELRNQLVNGSIPNESGVPQLISLYKQCADLVSSLSLFSPNESADEIASSELQYLLIDHHLAEALFKKRTNSPNERKDVVLTSRSFWERFLRRLDGYDLVSKSDLRIWERYLENRDGFEVAGSVNAASRREVKIGRFREEKDLKRKLEMLRDDPRLATDDAVVRKLHLANIALCVHETFQHLEYCSIEVQMLKMAPFPDKPVEDAQRDERERKKNGEAYSDRLDSSLASLLTNRTGPILDKSGKPLRPFTLLDKRIQLQDGVFRPDHNLPTMTIDEYLAEERRRGGIIDGGGEKSGQRPQIDEDDYEKADEETMKARKWDEFKEENPRGSGNTINRG